MNIKILQHSYYLAGTNTNLNHSKMMTDVAQASENFMEWCTGPKIGGEPKLRINVLIHSTPYQRRPLPTASPNLSAIYRPTYYDILQLADRLAQLKLN